MKEIGHFDHFVSSSVNDDIPINAVLPSSVSQALKYAKNSKLPEYPREQVARVVTGLKIQSPTAFKAP